MLTDKSALTPSVVPSPTADIMDRILGIAPTPLLPGEAEADYLGLAARTVAVAQPKDAIEEYLTRDVVDLAWDILRFAPPKSWSTKGRHQQRRRQNILDLPWARVR